jgi:metallo-beta-lactamase family protein
VTPRGELLVDCGMFQGPKSLRALNYRPFPFDPSRIAALLLTHAHIDHTGLFPKLALAGFRGRASATAATLDLLRWLLPDAGEIQENDVDRLNRRNAKRAEPPVTAIYTKADAEASLALIQPRPYETWFEPMPGIRARMRNAGHILGSAFIELDVDAEPGRPLRMVFSGDIGPRGKALQPDPSAPEEADIALVESTYGDRTRSRLSESERRSLLGRELAAGLKAGGNVIVPVFAVERTQEILDDMRRCFSIRPWLAGRPRFFVVIARNSNAPTVATYSPAAISGSPKRSSRARRSAGFMAAPSCWPARACAMPGG